MSFIYDLNNNNKNKKKQISKNIKKEKMYKIKIDFHMILFIAT